MTASSLYWKFPHLEKKRLCIEPGPGVSWPHMQASNKSCYVTDIEWLSLQKRTVPDIKVHGDNMEPTWGRQDPGGPHVGPMSLAIWGCQQSITIMMTMTMMTSATTKMLIISIIILVVIISHNSENDPGNPFLKKCIIAVTWYEAIVKNFNISIHMQPDGVMSRPNTTQFPPHHTALTKTSLKSGFVVTIDAPFLRARYGVSVVRIFRIKTSAL